MRSQRSRRQRLYRDRVAPNIGDTHTGTRYGQEDENATSRIILTLVLIVLIGCIVCAVLMTIFPEA